MEPDQCCSLHDTKSCVVFVNVKSVCNCCEGESFKNELGHLGQLHRIFVVAITDKTL